MHKVLIYSVVWCCFLLAAPATAEEPHHTTAFISSPGEIDTLITYSTYSTKHFWNRNGKKLPSYNKFKQNSYLLYSEYAFDDANSFFVNGGYSSVSESMNGSSNSFKDVELGWKHLLYEAEDHAIALECIGIVPVGNKKASIRYGDLGLQTTFLYSQVFCIQMFTAWADMGLGYRVYKGFPSDEVRAFLALGLQVHPSVHIIATGEVEYGVFNGDPERNLNNIVYHPNRRLFKGKVECVVRAIENVSISLGVFQHFWGQNIGAGGGGFCGTWIDF